MPALTLTNYNFYTARRNLVTFPEIYQRKFSFVNDGPMMIDISIATVYLGGVFTIFCLFFSFPPSFEEEDNPLLFCAYFD